MHDMAKKVEVKRHNCNKSTNWLNILKSDNVMLIIFNQNATNQPKSTVEFGYIWAIGAAAVTEIQKETYT